jgi:hypothetical protein
MVATDYNSIIIFNGFGKTADFKGYLNDIWELKLCNCKFGICNESSNDCITCDPNYYGLNCDKKCTCMNGFCDNKKDGTGKCTKCFPGYSGEDCNNNCLNDDCSVYCPCLSKYQCSTFKSTSQCQKDISVLEKSSSIINKNLTFDGDFKFKSTQMNIINSSLHIKADFSLAASKLMIDIDSSISVVKCINIDSVSSIQIDMKNIKKDALLFPIYLLTFNCSTLQNVKITHINSPKYDFSTTVTENTLMVHIKHNNDYDVEDNSKLILIIAVSILVVVVIIVVLFIVIQKLISFKSYS